MVEWKKLGEVCEVLRGKRLTKSQLSESEGYPVLHGGASPMGYYKDYNRKANTTVVVNTGNAGSVFFYDKPFWSSDACYSLYPNKNILDKYLYLYVYGCEPILKGKIRAGAMPTIDANAIKTLTIPIPPLEEQNRIVGILDTFTDSIENLKQQIAQRRKQYEHYRDQLLDLEGKEGVEMKTLGEIGEICMCKRIMKNQTAESGEVPFFKIGTFGSLPDAFISKTLFEEYKSMYSYPKKGDILISAAGTIGKSVIFDGKDAYFQDSNIVWIDNDETKVSNAFLRYFYQVAKWKTDGGTIKRLYNYNLKNTSISIPPLSEQQRIVSILDTFEASISNLEAQLEQRQKQYEYYRNQLLTFE